MQRPLARILPKRAHRAVRASLDGAVVVAGRFADRPRRALAIEATPAQVAAGVTSRLTRLRPMLVATFWRIAWDRWLLAALVLAHTLRVHRESGRWRPRLGELTPLAWGFGATVAACFVTSPYSFLDARNALRDYAAQSALSGVSQGSTAPVNFGPYLTISLPWSIGWPAYVAALADMVALTRARDERRLALLLFISFPVLFFLVIGSAHQPFTRYLVTLVPFPALSAGAATWWCARQAPGLWQRYLPQRRVPASWVQWEALSVLLVLVLTPTLFASVRFDGYLLRTDARTRAAAWFDMHVPANATIVIQPLFNRYFMTAPVMTTSQMTQLESEIPASRPAILATVDAYYHAHALYHDVPFVYDLAKLRAAGVRYIVLSDASTHNSGDDAAQDRFYAALRVSGTVIARFGPPTALPQADQYPVSSPIITIYALPAVADASG